MFTYLHLDSPDLPLLDAEGLHVAQLAVQVVPPSLQGLVPLPVHETLQRRVDLKILLYFSVCSMQ